MARLINRLQAFWTDWIHDGSQRPIERKIHPHEVLRPGARYTGAFLGAIVPTGLVWIRSGGLARLDNGPLQLGWLFWTMALVSGVIWLIGVLIAARLEEDPFLHDASASSAPPSQLGVVYLGVQYYD